MQHDLTLTRYTEKSYIVRGNTRAYKEVLKQCGGKYLPAPKDGNGPGWIFSLNRLKQLKEKTGISEEIEGETETSMNVTIPPIGSMLFGSESGTQYRVSTKCYLILHTLDEIQVVAQYSPEHNKWVISESEPLEILTQEQPQ